MAAVIILLAAAVAVGIAVTRRSSPSDQRPAGDPESVNVKSVAPRPYVATDLPKGFKVAGAAESSGVEETQSGEQPSSDSTNDPGNLVYTLFGPAEDDPRLAITIGPSITASSPGLQPFEIDGERLYSRKVGGITLVWRRRVDESVRVLGKGIDRQTLGRLALRVRVAGSPPNLLPKDLPTGWRRLGRSLLGEGVTSIRPLEVSGALGPAYLAVYTRTGTIADSSGPPISVTVRRGDEASLNAVRLQDGEAERTRIRGHTALLATRGGSSIRIRELTWLERPGVLIHVSGAEVSGAGFSLDSLRRVAEGLRPAGADEWRRLLELDSPAQSGLRDIAMGTLADGTVWTMAVQTIDEQPVATITLGLHGPLTSMFGPRDDGKDILSSGDHEREGRSFSYGMVDSNVARVALVGDDGHWIDSIPVAGSGYRGWLVEFTDFVDRKPLIVAYDAAGRELEHMPAKRLANYGSPTATVPTTVPQPGN